MGAAVPRLEKAHGRGKVRSAPVVIPFYGEGAGRLFTIYRDVTHEGSNPHVTHDPHVAHSTRVVGKRNWRGI